MVRSLIALLAFVISIFGAKISNPENNAIVRPLVSSDAPAMPNQVIEPQCNEIESHVGLLKDTRSFREARGTLLDSSKNGYGLFSLETNPIAASGDNILISYRSWDGLDGSSGVLGAALSVDAGNTWQINTGINSSVGSMARYPSALLAENYPIVMWNEYGGGGGIFGQRAYYSFATSGLAGNDYALPIDVSDNPTENDLAKSLSRLNYDNSGNVILNAFYVDYTTGGHMHTRATSNAPWDGSSFAWSQMEQITNISVFLGEWMNDHTISTGSFDINDDGVGYYSISGYWADTTVISNHTVFVKRTEDYGLTWSEWSHFSDESLNNYFSEVFPDSVWDESSSSWKFLPDGWKLFINYDIETLVDANGNLHIFAGVFPDVDFTIYHSAWDESDGLYHFKVPNDANWGGEALEPSINFIASMYDTWNHGEPFFLYGNAWSSARDLSLDGHLYIAYSRIAGNSTLTNSLDIFGSYSTDYGTTWSEPFNITQTEDSNVFDEADPHLAIDADNGTIRMVYQIPNWEVPTTGAAESSKDYMNYIYYNEYSFEDVVIVNIDDIANLPTEYKLDQNFPNPFNPSTTLRYGLPEDSNISLVIYDVRGQVVQTLESEHQSAGWYDVVWNGHTAEGKTISTGIYFARLVAGDYSQVVKMLYLK